jgi:adenosylcobinamide-phosphate synthase
MPLIPYVPAKQLSVCYLSPCISLIPITYAMSLFALIVALLLEQLHPLSSRKQLYGWLIAYVNFFHQHFNTGEHRHGKIAWLLAVLPLLAGAVALFLLFYHAAHPVFAWAFNVLVLYLTMGFRQFSHYFTDIHQALRENKLEEARNILSRWCGKIGRAHV